MLAVLDPKLGQSFTILREQLKSFQLLRKLGKEVARDANLVNKSKNEVRMKTLS